MDYNAARIEALEKELDRYRKFAEKIKEEHHSAYLDVTINKGCSLST